jgi:hypothetical protein
MFKFFKKIMDCLKGNTQNNIKNNIKNNDNNKYNYYTYYQPEGNRFIVNKDL